MTKIVENLTLTFDIVAVSETWTYENCIYHEIAGYLFYIDRANKQGGRVALYVSNMSHCRHYFL